MQQKKVLLWTIAICLLAGFFGFLNVIELRAEEPRRAIVSLEMLLSNNWVVPEINGWTYYNKPPLFNWLMAAFFAIFGSADEWVVRLPSLLSFLALAIVHYRVVNKYLGQNTALLSVLFLLTSADLLFYGTVNSGEIDLFYALLVYLQVISIFEGFQSGKFLRMFLLSYLWVALGFLTKGLPSLAFQVFTLIAVAIYYRKFLLLFGWKHLSGILLFTALCGIYLWFYDQQDNAVAFLVRQFKEASQRTGLETDFTDTLLQSLSFPFQLAALLLPWSLLLITLFRKGMVKEIRSQPFIAFAVLFVLVNIPLYWFSGDFKPRYYYMFFPFICTVMSWFYLTSSAGKQRIIQNIFAVIAILLPLGLVTLYFVPELQSIPYSRLSITIFIIIMIVLTYLQWKSKARILYMVLIMAVLRLALNILYLPALQQYNNGMYYRDAMADLLKISGDEKIWLYGSPYEFYSDASLGPFTLEQVKLTTAPLLAYQIPYYISRENEKVVEFSQELRSGNLYLAAREDLNNPAIEVIYSFEDKWKHREMVLFRQP